MVALTVSWRGGGDADASCGAARGVCGRKLLPAPTRDASLGDAAATSTRRDVRRSEPPAKAVGVDMGPGALACACACRAALRAGGNGMRHPLGQFMALTRWNRERSELFLAVWQRVLVASRAGGCECVRRRYDMAELPGKVEAPSTPLLKGKGRAGGAGMKSPGAKPRGKRGGAVCCLWFVVLLVLPLCGAFFTLAAAVLYDSRMCFLPAVNVLVFVGGAGRRRRRRRRGRGRWRWRRSKRQGERERERERERWKQGERAGRQRQRRVGGVQCETERPRVMGSCQRQRTGKSGGFVGGGNKVESDHWAGAWPAAAPAAAYGEAPTPPPSPRDACPSPPMQRNRLPVHAAAIAGYSEVVRVMMASSDADVDSEDREGFTCLHFASMEGHWRTVKVLVNAKAEIDRPNNVMSVAQPFAVVHSPELACPRSSLKRR